MFSSFTARSHWEHDRCVFVALPVGYLLELSTKPVTTRTITAARAGCVRRRMDDDMPFSVHGSRNATGDDPRPNILQLNTKGPTTNKICVIEQILADKNTAFIIVTNETHRTSVDKLVIHDLSLGGSVLIRNHDLVTFVHEWLEWSLIDQSPEQCACPAVLGQHRPSCPASS